MAVSVIVVPAPAHLVAVLVEDEVADRAAIESLVRSAGAPARRIRARSRATTSSRRERLGDVVVATGGQAGDPVLDRVAGGQEEHRYVGLVAAQPPEHLHAVEVGQHHVEHDRVRSLGLRRSRRPCVPLSATSTSQPS